MFGSETWVLLAPMAQRLEVVHMGFMRQETKSKAKLLSYRSWQSDKKISQGVETQLLQTYLDKRKLTVTEWVALRPIFDVYETDTGI